MQARGYGGGEGGGRKHEHQFHARQVYIGWVGVRLVLWMVVWAVMCVCVIMEWVHNGRYPSIESASITGLQVLTNERQVLTNKRHHNSVATKSKISSRGAGIFLCPTSGWM